MAASVGLVLLVVTAGVALGQHTTSARRRTAYLMFRLVLLTAASAVANLYISGGL